MESSAGGGRRNVAQAQRVALLEGVPLFDGVPKRHLRHLAKLTRIEQFEAGQDMIVEGQPATTAFVIIAGSATVRRRGRRIGSVGAGDVVGELGLILNRPRAATVRTDTPVECLALDRRGLESAVKELPGLGWLLLQTVADRLAAG